MIHPLLQSAHRSFFVVYANVKLSLKDQPRQSIIELQHEAEEIRRSMTVPFSERAAAEMCYAATVQLLEGK